MKKAFQFISKCLALLALLLLAFCAVYPLLFLFGGSLKSTQELGESLAPLWAADGNLTWPWLPWDPTLQHYVELLLDSPGYFVMFWNSVKIVAGAILGQLLFGLPAAWAFARWEFAGKKILMPLYIVLMLFPFQVLMLSEYLVLNQMGLLDTLWAVVLPSAFSTFPVFIMYRFYAKLPSDIVEAAKLDGANEWQIFWHIGVPLGVSGMMAVVVLAFLEYWNLIEQPAVFLRPDDLKPLSLYISTITGDRVGLAFVGGLVALLPPLLIFLCGRRYLEQGIAATAIKD